MLFQTWEFVFFFLITLGGFLLLRATRFWQAWLLVASYVFYGWWNPLFLLLILYTTTADYFLARGMACKNTAPGWAKICITLSVCNNLFLLGFFKYAGFFTENLRWLFQVCSIPLEVPEPNILLPVGISFFTFQSMSYCIDVFRGELRCERNWIRYAAFVALFPQLVAGPIERATNLLRQLRHKPLIYPNDIGDGLSLFIVGLFKKLVMADTFAVYVNLVYDDPASFDAWTLLFATYAFAWQIYCDFSGYTDMARGVAKIMGIRLRLNFNNPYTAVDLGDFWRRWHISLSSWFRDYVYIPLGGNRVIKYRVWWNVFFTMLVSGFWHGAAWNFLIWGGLNGIGRVLTMPFDHAGWYLKMPKIIKQILVYHFICLTWVFFRAPTFSDAMTILHRFFTGASGDSILPIPVLTLIGMLWLYQLWYNTGWKAILATRPVRYACLAIVLLLLLFVPSSAYQQFIYFQF